MNSVYSLAIAVRTFYCVRHILALLSIALFLVSGCGSSATPSRGSPQRGAVPDPAGGLRPEAGAEWNDEASLTFEPNAQLTHVVGSAPELIFIRRAHPQSQLDRTGFPILDRKYSLKGANTGHLQVKMSAGPQLRALRIALGTSSSNWETHEISAEAIEQGQTYTWAQRGVVAAFKIVEVSTEPTMRSDLAYGADRAIERVWIAVWVKSAVAGR